MDGKPSERSVEREGKAMENNAPGEGDIRRGVSKVAAGGDELNRYSMEGLHVDRACAQSS
jgi:hypothetical protein